MTSTYENIPHVAGTTAFAAAFAKRGIHPAEVELRIALAKFRNNGRPFEDAMACVRDAYADKLSGKGHSSAASDGQSGSAQPRQPVEDEAGHENYASGGQLTDAPSSSSDRGGEGQTEGAGNGRIGSAPPVREPSAAQLAASARVEAASARTALSLLDRMKTSDGKAWGNVGAHELAGMQRDGVMAKAISDWIGPLAGDRQFKPIRELMNEKQFELVLARVRGQYHDA